MIERMKRQSGILVLHKMLDILESIRRSSSGIGLADLARAAGLPKPTAYRIVATLEARGYAARDASGRYQITRKFFELQQDESDEKVLTHVAHPVMERLVESCRETVNLGILDAAEVVVIATIESPQTVRMASKIGNRRYLHSTALGKVLLSGLPAKELERLFRTLELPRLTPQTLTSRKALDAELEQVRRLGYAMDNEENEVGGRCVGVPIVGRGSRVVAALSISAPVFRMDLARAQTLAVELSEACREISSVLTSRP